MVVMESFDFRASVLFREDSMTKPLAQNTDMETTAPVTGMASAASAGGDWEYATECLEQGGNFAITDVSVASPSSTWLHVTGWNLPIPERAVIKGVSLRALYSGVPSDPTNFCFAIHF
jgi:hypothetical protein